MKNRSFDQKIRFKGVKKKQQTGRDKKGKIKWKRIYTALSSLSQNNKYYKR